MCGFFVLARYVSQFIFFIFFKKESKIMFLCARNFISFVHAYVV